MTRQLTPKQQLFCEEYLCSLNATQAAIKAEYSEKTAEQLGYQLLQKTSVQKYIRQHKQDRANRTEITQDYVLKTIYETVERCRQVSPVLGKDGKQVMVETPDGQELPAYVFDAKNVLKGCELLGKHLGIFEKDNAQKPAVIFNTITRRIVDCSGGK